MLGATLIPKSAESNRQKPQQLTALNIFHIANNLNSLTAHAAKINRRALKEVVRQDMSHFLFLLIEN